MHRKTKQKTQNAWVFLLCCKQSVSLQFQVETSVPRSSIAAEDVLSLVSPTPWKRAATLYKFSVTENTLQKKACVYWFSNFRGKLIACHESSLTTQLQAMFTDSRGESRSTYPQIGRKKVTLETCTQNTSNIYPILHHIGHEMVSHAPH
jgi:hypothetical protein